MLNPNKNERAGNEFYTPAFVVRNIIKSYDHIFSQYDYIWLPFNSDDKAMYREMNKVYGDKIITTPDSCFDKKLGFNNFFLFKNDDEFMNFLNTNKVLVFDNPPFDRMASIIRYLKNNKHQGQLFGIQLKKDIDFILFGDALTGLNYFNKYKICYHILGRVPFVDALNKKGDNKRICVALFSNLFNTIESNFNIAGKWYRKLKFNKKINLHKVSSEWKGVLSSASLINIAQRGYVFEREKFKPTSVKKFGGSIFYDFNTLEKCDETPKNTLEKCDC